MIHLGTTVHGVPYVSVAPLPPSRRRVARRYKFLLAMLESE